MMFRFAPYVLKTLWRHRTRTLLTVSGSAVALFVFCFVGSVQQGLDSLSRQREAQRTLVVFQANKFCPATSHLPQDYDRKIAQLPGVRQVVPIQVYTNNCRASLDVVVFYGLPAEALNGIRDFQLIEGDWSQFERHQDAAMVGQGVAQRRQLHAGDKFSIGGITVTVAGVFACENRAEENYIYTHLDFLQRRQEDNRVGTVTQFEVQLDESADISATCAAVDNALRTGQVETDTRAKGVFQADSLGDLTELIGLTHYLGYACVGLLLALVATTTIMTVQDRAAEHAVLQTIGFSGPRIFGLVLWQSVLMSLAGGALGVGLAMLVLAQWRLAIGAEAVTIAFTPSLWLTLMGMGVALVAGIVAGIAPALQAARADIVPALKQAY